MKGTFSIINIPAMLNEQMPAEEISFSVTFLLFEKMHIFVFGFLEGLVIDNTDLQATAQ